MFRIPKRVLLRYAFLTLLATTVASYAVKMAVDAYDTATIERANATGIVPINNGFCFRLLNEIAREQPDGNITISPFSICEALAMTTNGTSGPTQAAMESTLGIQGVSLAKVNEGNRLLLLTLRRPGPKVELSIANSLWADNQSEFNSAFLTTSQHDYDANTESLDFSSPAAAAAINRWASDATRGHIGGLVTPDELQPGGMALANAMYFHGQWSNQFPPQNTESSDFTLEGGAKKTVEMMTKAEKGVLYGETSACQAVSLPYGSGRMSMVILLPKQKRTVEQTVESLDAKSFSLLVDQMVPQLLWIDLPRFTADSTTNLVTPLTAMGMGRAFKSGPDFGLMGMPKDSRIDCAVNQSTLRVDEEGTVATSFTFFEVKEKGREMPDHIVNIDHPFFYAIRDNKTGAILFAGIERDPNS